MRADDTDPDGGRESSDPGVPPTGDPMYGSDVVVAMLKTFGIKYIALNPGGSFRHIHESLVAWGGNQNPEIIECLHEEIAVAIAHGYAASSGVPMAAIVHDIVGLQHASISIYHAWQNRMPVIVLGGTGPMDTTKREPKTDWGHTALVQGNLVRDFTKWDDQPASAMAIPNSFIRAYRVATSPPAGPVYVCYDTTIQEDRLEQPINIPDLAQYPAPTRLQADEAALEDVADRLVSAKNPVIIAEYAGQYPGAGAALAGLAELLGAPVLGRPGRFNLASNHPLHLVEGGRDLVDDADVILAVEVLDLYGFFWRKGRGPYDDARDRDGTATGPRPRRAWLAHVTLGDLGIRAWSQTFQELAPVDREIRAEAGVVLPRLLALCRDRMTTAARTAAAARGDVIGQRSRATRKALLAKAETSADATPITLAALALALRAALEPHPWVITKGRLRDWLWRILEVERPDQWVGIDFAGGLANGLGFSLGVALHRRDDDVVCVDVQGDGDLLYTPSALWTAAHHRLPILIVVYNNRSYHGTAIHTRHVVEDRARSGDIAVGIRMDDPPIDLAAMAKTFGVASEGPIVDPALLLPSLERAARIVREERRPVLVEVIVGEA